MNNDNNINSLEEQRRRKADNFRLQATATNLRKSAPTAAKM